MPASFVFALFLAVTALVAVIAWLGTRGRKIRLPGVVPVLLLVLAVIFVGLSSVTTVGARSIGIVTTFGRPVDALSAGLHAKAPWQKVADLDGKKQTTNFGGPGSSLYDTITVRLGSEGNAEVQASVRWSIATDKTSATELYADYRDMSQITDSLIARETRSAVGLVFNNFNPLAKIQRSQNDDGGTLPTYDEFSQQITKRLSDRVGKYVTIDSVIVQYVAYDKGTQAKLNAYASEVAETRVAEQREATARAQARANEALSRSISNDPNVLVKQCLDALDKLIENGGTPPIGFTCWPGGSTPPVIVNSGSN